MNEKIRITYPDSEKGICIGETLSGFESRNASRLTYSDCHHRKWKGN